MGIQSAERLSTYTLNGRGRTADVYLYDTDRIIKLFHEDFPREAIHGEFTLGTIIQQSGLPVPKIIGRTVLAGREGILFEYRQGVSMLARLMQRPWTVTRLARMLAALHHTVHQTGIDALPSQKESLSYAITSTSLLDDAAKEQVLAILSRLPHGNTVCHGDFHPDNILLTSDGPVIIDWITCTNGTAAADIARSQILMMKSALPPGMHPITQRILLGIRSLFYATYIREYRKRSGITDDEINAWMLPVAAARLNENLFPEEVDLLLTIIRRYTALSSPQKDKRQKEHETLHHTSR